MGVTRLERIELTLPVAALGPENPLPVLRAPRELHEVDNLDRLPTELADNIRYGALRGLSPCLLQDGYTRARVPTAVPALVLENDHVRATVLPGYGGRLWSLEVDGRELLYRNPVVQPANLALRNAWLAGGVEWNLGSTGHWTGTCEPLHAATVDGPDGTPVLRLWEFERTRGLVVQLDFWLPADSALLYVGVRIRNPQDQVVPAYWWSNIAVPQSPGGRVLAPADQAWYFGYQGTLDLIDVPGHDGIDLSYPMRHRRAADFFFELPAGQPPWICAVDENGDGLFQASTSRLRGRKLFVWGTGRGGRRWQDWLAPGAGGDGYTEIQAGLARTQLEHLKLPAATSWSWLEAYGSVAVDDAHGPWPEARTNAGRRIEPVVADLDERHQRWLASADTMPGERLFTGSGWGALEAPDLLGTPFDDDTLGPRQQPWLELRNGVCPATDPAAPPDGTLVAPAWHGLLEAAPDGWFTWYHRGVARWHASEHEQAREAWERSLEIEPTAWALRNLAVTAVRPSVAAGLYSRAVALAPALRPLVIEALDLLVGTERLAEATELLTALSPELRSDGRVRLAEVRVRTWFGSLEIAADLLAAGIEIADLREGENGLAEAWRDVQEALQTREPVPQRYEFGMFD